MSSHPEERIDLSDPSCEPSDEALQQLSERAFQHVGRENERALESLRRDIEARREEVLRHLAVPTRTER